MTFFSVFDVPVFWPILLLYWCVLFFVTMKRQIRHMIKYRYIPFSFGKKVSKFGTCDIAVWCSQLKSVFSQMLAHRVCCCPYIAVDDSWC